MNKKQKEKWDKIRQAGKKKFLIKYGIFWFGIPLFVCNFFISIMILNLQVNYVEWIVKILVYPFAGMILASFYWVANERMYKMREPE